MIITLWTTAFLAEMPSFLGWGGHSYDTKTMSCMWDRTADFTYTLFISVGKELKQHGTSLYAGVEPTSSNIISGMVLFFAGGVAAPVFLIAFCYLKIFMHVRASKKRVAGAAEDSE